MGLNTKTKHMKFAFFLSKSKAFLLFVLVVFPLALMSQVKGPLEVIDGKKFYVHKVEKGQTLYAISRLYACDINDILSANPGADQGLKEGQTLKVPAPASQKVEEKDPPKADPKTTGEKLHEVQRKETLYAIAKMYDVDINEIIAINPGVDQGLKKGQMLRIPSKEKKVEAPVVTVPSEPKMEQVTNTRSHTVVAGETLYSIAKDYATTVEAISDANPGLGTSLTIGQIIVVPTRGLPREPTKPNHPIVFDGPTSKEKYSIALMLPFMTADADTVGLTDKEKKLRDVAVNLYRGALMAADSLKANGFNADIYVYDVGDSKYTAQAILQKPEMKGVDLIIGPAFRDPLNEVSTWAAKNGAHVVCPVPQSNKVLLASPNMSKAYPSEATQWEAVAIHIAAKYPSAKVIVVNTTDVDDLKNLNVFQESFYRAHGDSAVEFKAASHTLNGIASLLSSGQNVVVIPSTDKFLLTTMFGQLKGNNIVLFGPDSWENIDVINGEDRLRTHLHFAKASYVDLYAPGPRAWHEAYKKKYKSEPLDYAYLGYDLMLYYGRGLQMFGKTFPNHFAEIPTTGIEGWGFRFYKTGNESGFENKHVFILGTEETGMKIQNP